VRADTYARSAKRACRTRLAARQEAEADHETMVQPVRGNVKRSGNGSWLSRVAAGFSENAARARRCPVTSPVTWDGGPDDELLDARQAATLLTVKPSTLLAWAREGRVPVVRLGPRHLRWTRPLPREIRDAAVDVGRRF
jgi:hypothetical protein